MRGITPDMATPGTTTKRPNDSSTGGFIVPTISTVSRLGKTAGLPAPAEDDELDRQLRLVVSGVTGLDPKLVRKRWYPKPPPQPPADVDWCAVGHTTLDGSDNPTVEHDGCGEGFDVVTVYEVLGLDVTFYGPDAWSYARILRTGLVVDANMAEMLLYGLVFDDAGPPRRVPDFVGEEHRKRVDLDIRLKRAVSSAYPVRNLRSIPVQVVTPGFVNERKVDLP